VAIDEQLDMPVKFTTCLLLILVLSPAAAVSAELRPFAQDHRVGVAIERMRVPPTLRKDLVSGLTNRVLIKIELLQNGRPASRKVVEVWIRYDLWEETFSVDTRIDSAVVSSRTYRQVDEVVSMLSNLKLPALFAAAPSTQGSQLGLTAEVLFNPVDKERMDEIREWVAENSAPALPDPTSVRPGLSSPPRASSSRALFNKLFEQYAAGASLAAAWKDSGSSRQFTLEELPAEPPP
jgi:hypothetical protein